MRILRVLAILILVYVGIVVAFESLLGWFQPQSGDTLVITTFDEEGNPHERVVSRLESQGDLYVAANHWPRAWYHQALANPRVRVTIDGETRDYQVIPVSGAEHDRVAREHELPTFFRFLTGFPPRYFVRLEPR